MNEEKPAGFDEEGGETLVSCLHYLLRFMDEKEALTALTTPAPHFGDLPPVEFADEVNWDAVMSTFKRILE